MNFDDTIDNTYKFYGVYDMMFKIGPYIFEAVEDPDDGYRSYLTSVEVRTDEKLVFLGKSFATVRVEELNEGEFGGYQLVDVEDGHRWLKFGTDYADDYYPCFVFRYTIKDEHVTPADKEPAEPFNQQMSEQLRVVQQAMKDGDLGEAEELLNKLAKKLL